jgi:nucleoid-associated protein YgaU
MFKNSEETYEEILEDRGVEFINQYGSPRLFSPSVGQRASLTRVRHIWKVGDRYYKLAIKYYGGAQYWWLIALYNKRPTEANINIGDIVVIPLPLDKILRMIGT